MFRAFLLMTSKMSFSDHTKYYFRRIGMIEKRKDVMTYLYFAKEAGMTKADYWKSTGPPKFDYSSDKDSETCMKRIKEKGNGCCKYEK
jgi:hypothetical protein